MANEFNPVDQAVSRALRENLERILRLTEEVQLAISDVASACANPKPAAALPPMMRAQASAASLAASLEVLSRFVSTALQPAQRSASEEAAASSLSLPEVARPAPPPRVPAPVPAPVPVPVSAPIPAPAPVEAAPPAVAPRPAPPPPPPPPPPVVAAPVPEPVEEVLEMNLEEAAGVEQEFDINRLSPEEQELHRRANRVAKVSMQDIKMLKPEQVKLGRQNRDICTRLQDDIDKAHKEYERRFRSILAHPVDYFYHWLVQILADGDADAVGNYPYAS